MVRNSTKGIPTRTPTLAVTGVKELVSALQQLPIVARKRVLKSAVSKASTPVVKAAKKLVPLGAGLKPDGSPREHLRKTITKTAAKVYKNGSVVVTIGPRYRAAPHSHLVDLGTKPHDIRFTKHVFLNGRPVIFPGQVIQHPGAKAAHFMQGALDAVGDKSRAALEQGIAKGIEKEAAKLAGKK